MNRRHPYRCAAIAILLTAAAAFTASVCRADLKALDDGDLAGISGMGGISVGLDDVSVYLHLGSFSYTDTDSGNALVLEGVTAGDGDGRPAAFATGNVDTDGDGLRTPLTVDVGTVGDRAAVVLQALDWQQVLDLHVETLRFCGQALGSLDLGPIHRPSFYWMVGGHDDGIDFELAQRLSIDAFEFTYNDAGDRLDLAGIHLGAADTGDPADPATWEMNGLFRIGAMADGNPATFDVGQGDDGLAAIDMNLPMSGAVRVESVQWAGADFGPMAIDGIQVHRLNIRLIP